MEDGERFVSSKWEVPLPGRAAQAVWTIAYSAMVALSCAACRGSRVVGSASACVHRLPPRAAAFCTLASSGAAVEVRG